MLIFSEFLTEPYQHETEKVFIYRDDYFDPTPTQQFRKYLVVNCELPEEEIIAVNRGLRAMVKN